MKRLDEFKTIPGFSNYLANRSGEVYSKITNRILRPFTRAKHGYYVLTLRNDRGKRKCCRLHGLILVTFIGPRPIGFQGAHLNGIKSDNRLVNLKWCSVRENSSHRFAHGTVVLGRNHHSNRLHEKDIPIIREMKRKGESTKRIAQKYGVADSSIWAIISGKTWKHI